MVIPFNLIATVIGLLALVGGLHALVYTLKESGKAECRAEQAEAARMAELRARERTNIAAGGFEADRRTIAAKSRTTAIEAAKVANSPDMRGSCLTDDSVRLINSRIGKAGDTAKPEPTVPTAPDHAGR